MTEGIALPEENRKVPVVFSHDVVVFPHMEVTLSIAEKRSAGAVLRALREHHLIAFVPADFERTSEGVGTLSLVTRSEQRQDGVQVDLRGLWRVRVMNPLGLDSDEVVQIERAQEAGTGGGGDDDDGEVGREDGEAERRRLDGDAVMKRVKGQIAEFSEILPDIPREIIAMLKNARTASELSDLCAMSPALTHEERVYLLRTLDPEERLRMVNRHLDRQLEMLRTMAKTNPIPDCEACADLADRAFDANPAARGELTMEFLNHVVSNHTAELLNLLAERYGPTFMKKRSLR